MSASEAKSLIFFLGFLFCFVFFTINNKITKIQDKFECDVMQYVKN